MKIRTDYITNSSSSSYTVDLYGIDADGCICYHMDANQDDEYPQLIKIYGIEEGISTVIDPDKRFDLYGFDDNKIDSLPALLTVLRQITMIENILDDEELDIDDIDDESFEKGYEVRKDWRSDCREAGDIEQASEIILVCGKHGYGESLIEFDDRGNKSFVEMRKRYSKAHRVEEKKIVDEAIRFFHDLPEWEAKDGLLGRLFINDKSRSDYKRYLAEGVEERNANYYQLAIIDPKTFVIKRTVDILTWLGFLKDEKCLQELLKRLDYKFSAKPSGDNFPLDERLMDRISEDRSSKVTLISSKERISHSYVGRIDGNTKDKQDVSVDEQPFDGEKQFQILVKKFRESSRSVSELDKLVYEEPRIPIEQLKRWAIREKGCKLSSLLKKVIEEETVNALSDSRSLVNKDLPESIEEQFRILVSRYRKKGTKISSVAELTTDNPDLPIERMGIWAIKEKKHKLLPLLNSAIKEEADAESDFSNTAYGEEQAPLSVSGSISFLTEKPIADNLDFHNSQMSAWEEGDINIENIRVDKAGEGNGDSICENGDDSIRTALFTKRFVEREENEHRLTLSKNETCGTIDDAIAQAVSIEATKTDNTKNGEHSETDVLLSRAETMVGREKALGPIPIGEEPENIKKRLDTLFEKLSFAYPDKEIFRLDIDHKEWGKTATDLYRKLGYLDRRSFLEAYGFTFKEGMYSGGRPKTRINDVPTEMFFDELKMRYPNGSVYTTAKELLRANPDLQGGYDSLRKKAQELFGMPLHEYMKKEGFLCTPEIAFRLLRARYSQPFEGNYAELREANKDLNWKMLHDFSIENGFVSLDRFLYQKGILADSPEIAEAKAAAKELSFILEEIKKRMNGEKYGNLRALRLSSELSDLKLGRLNKLIRTVHHVEPFEFLVQEGIVLPQTNDNIEQKKSKGKQNQPISTRDNEALGRAVINQENLLSAGFTGKITVVPEGVRRIGKQAFCDNSVVEIVYLPSSLETIDEKGFYNCHRLKTVYYDGKQLEAGPKCFYGCEELAFIGDSKKLLLNPAFHEYLSMLARVRNLVEDMVSLQSEYLREQPSDKTKRLARLEIAALMMHLMRETSEYSSQMRQLLNCICGGEVSVGEVVESVVVRNSEFDFLRLFYKLRRHQRYHARDKYLRVVRRVINCIHSFVQNDELDEKGDELLLALEQIKESSC